VSSFNTGKKGCSTIYFQKSPLRPSLPKRGTPNSSPFEKGGLRGIL